MHALADDLGCPVAALNFLGDYLTMLPARLARILRHTNEQNYEPAIDAVISLKVSSAMTGAVETELHCRAVESLLRNHRWDEARTAAKALNGVVDTYMARGPQMISKFHAELRHRLPLSSL